jgi:ABC-type nitrate/sulfonate/bicarbonate transport system permease component
MAATDVIAPSCALSKERLLQLATLVAIWAAWEAVAQSGLVWHGAVPSSFAILRALFDMLATGDFYIQLAVTLAEVLAALVIGGVLGLAVGLVLGADRFLGRAFEPYLHYLAPTPKIVFLPVIMLLAGVGPPSKVALGALSCFFPMALSIAVGVREVNPVLLRVGRSFRLSTAQTVRKIYLPALMPPIVTGLRLSLGLALVGCLLAEVKMASAGLGFLAMQDYNRLDIPGTYAVLVVIFVLAAAGNALVGQWQRRTHVRAR